MAIYDHREMNRWYVFKADALTVKFYMHDVCVCVIGDTGDL